LAAARQILDWATLYSLADMPHRCPGAPESKNGQAGDAHFLFLTSRKTSAVATSGIRLAPARIGAKEYRSAMRPISRKF